MVAKLKARKEGRDIIIDKDSFELILIAMASQRFVGEAPPNGDAMAMGKEEYDKAQRGMQEDIDDIYRQGMDILHSKSHSKTFWEEMFG